VKNKTLIPMNVRFLPFLLFVVFSVTLLSCKEEVKPEDKKTPEQLATEALTGTGTQLWTVAGGGSVTRDGQNVTTTFATFELFLNAGASKTYSTRNAADLFDANGTWAFAGSNFDKFTLSGTKPAATREISFTQSGTTLRLDFRIPAPGARIGERTEGTASIAGSYSFILQKK
jgi:hypothetical protein